VAHVYLSLNLNELHYTSFVMSYLLIFGLLLFLLEAELSKAVRAFYCIRTHDATRDCHSFETSITEISVEKELGDGNTAACAYIATVLSA
jgi:hypothetical protein